MLVPLLEGGAAGPLSAAELANAGVEVVAVDLLELVTGPGLDQVDAAGGLRRFLAAEQAILAIARVASEGDTERGWRGRGLARLLDGQGGVLRLQSPVDGRLTTITLDELAGWAEAAGAWPSAQFSLRGPVFTFWDRASGAAPPGELVVSPLLQGLSRDGTFWDGQRWQALEDVVEPDRAQLIEGCDCRACAEASLPYLLHLWRSHELTAQVLLGWHNLRWLREIAEQRPAAPFVESAFAGPTPPTP